MNVNLDKLIYLLEAFAKQDIALMPYITVLKLMKSNPEYFQADLFESSRA